MNLGQRIRGFFYPAVMWLNKITGIKAQARNNAGNTVPPVSLYDLSVQLNNGETVSLSAWKGKKILFVNTASDCIYTRQYEMLQRLWEQHRDQLLVIGFPANDFREQEQADDTQIAQFCQVNFGVSFPLSKKTTVISDADQHPVYQWLTQPEKNGWNSQQPSWNFAKYLVDESGNLVACFDPGVPPLSDKITSYI